MEEQYFCPECKGLLEKIQGCGSVGYFCDNCKKLVSRKRILTEEQLKDKDLNK